MLVRSLVPEVLSVRYIPCIHCVSGMGSSQTLGILKDVTAHLTVHDSPHCPIYLTLSLTLTAFISNDIKSHTGIPHLYISIFLFWVSSPTAAIHVSLFVQQRIPQSFQASFRSLLHLWMGIAAIKSVPIPSNLVRHSVNLVWTRKKLCLCRSFQYKRNL
jgi:hypothetical protein